MEKSMALFLATLLHSGTNTHFFHWATKSYAKHKTLGHFYENIIELTDQLAECYFGIYGQITQFPSTYSQKSRLLTCNHYRLLLKMLDQTYLQTQRLSN